LNLVFLLLGSVAAGFVGGFLGLGGGIILVPFLTVIFKIPMHNAVAISLAAITANSIVSSNEYLKKDHVDFKAVIPLAIFATIGAVAAGSVSHLIPAGFLKIIFAVFLLYTIYSLLTRKEKKNIYAEEYIEPGLWKISIVAFLAGVVAALTGVGGGVVIIPGLYIFFKYNISLARGSSAFTIGIIAAAGTLVYLISGTLDVEMVGPVMLGMMGGAFLGGRLGARAKSMIVRVAFSAVLLYLAARMFIEGIG